MKLDAILNHSEGLTRRGFAGLLLFPAAAVAARNDDFGRNGDFRRGRGYSQTWRAMPSDNYDPRRPDGRFDLRAYVDGDTEFAIRGNEVTWRAFQGGAPRDAGCEFRKEIPRAEMYGVRLDQRDGRSRMQIVETPSPRNGWALVLRVSDPKGGDDRYHARITWESDGGFERGRGGYDYDRNGYGRGRY